MNQITLILLAFTGGVLLAIQGGLNAQLGVYLKNPLLATFIAFFYSTSFAFLGVAISIKSYPSLEQIRQVPAYLWFSGAIFSVFGISLYYYTIPKLGISSMVSLGLSGQLIFSVFASHFGWFGLPEDPIAYKKILGVLTLIISIIMING